MVRLSAAGKLLRAPAGPVMALPQPVRQVLPHVSSAGPRATAISFRARSQWDGRSPQPIRKFEGIFR